MPITVPEIPIFTDPSITEIDLSSYFQVPNYTTTTTTTTSAP